MFLNRAECPMPKRGMYARSVQDALPVEGQKNAKNAGVRKRFQTNEKFDRSSNISGITQGIS